MIEKEKVVVEPSSCTTLAALIDHPNYDFGSQVALVLTGSSIDVELMKDIMMK